MLQATATNERNAILSALDAFIRQRPGLEFGNYADGYRDTEGRRAYFREMRSITRDLHDARTLLAYVGRTDAITAGHLKDALRDSYSGRLTWTPDDSNGGRLDYCTGQYFPTEYRKAVCAVLGSAIFHHAARGLPLVVTSDRPGDLIRREVAHMIGKKLQRKWAD